MAESDIEHLSQSIKTAAAIVKRKNNWKHVRCVEKDELLPKEVIHKRVYDIVHKELTKI